MKRILTITLAVLLLLTMASCGNQPVEPSTPTQPTTTPEIPTEPAPPPEPEWEPGISRATYGEALYVYLDKGAEVNVIGQFKDYFIISGEDADLVVEKRFIRLDSEDPFESWDGYARKGTLVFDSVYMREEAIAELSVNTKVTVLEGKGDWLCNGHWLYIQWEGGEGYVEAEQISDRKISGGRGNGGGSGPADGTDVDIGGLSAYFGPEMEEGFEGGKGLVLAEEIEAYLCLLLRDQEAKVTEYTEEICVIYLGDGFYATVPRWLLRLEGDEEYEAWNGYISGTKVVFEEYQMRNELMTLKTNHEVVVLDELPDCYVIEVDGVIGYVELDGVSETRITYHGGGGGGGGGGSSDGWTPPAM